MKLLCAVDREWAIGRDGDLLFHIPEDLKRFKDMTESNVVVMGRKTLESLPGGLPLRNRINIVITSRKDYELDNGILVNSIDQLLSQTDYYRSQGRKIYLIGGGNLIAQLINRVDQAYITKINKSVKGSDTRIPNLDLDDSWILEDVSETYDHKGIMYRYNFYRRA